jgi:thiosulfate/3-mercaptopyruvate sulfurtransferase
MTAISERGYSHPDLLVSTDWVAPHNDDANIRVVESNEDQLLYPSGHIPGAVEVDWTEDLNHPVVRDYIDTEMFEALMSRLGISNDTTVVFYGDKSNWWAAYALWVFQLFGHDKVKLMDGGRLKWEQEGREMTREKPSYTATEYTSNPRNDAPVRVFRDEVLQHIKAGRPLVDVRSPGEFSGELLHMANYPQEGSLRGGHIPGAKNISWSKAANEDGTFKTADELRAIYVEENGLDPNGEEVVTYCRIGERSSHSWFVLKYLLGFDNVRNYDGSWTEWGNAVNVPIEK